MNSRATRPAQATSALKVQAALLELGLEIQVMELEVPARTATQAALALGLETGQIAKSLVFCAVDSGQAVLVVCAGDQRVDEAKVSRQIGARIERADPVFVREQTGFAIGGIPPLGHIRPLTVLLDVSLQRFEIVWAAGGTPHAVFPISPVQLASALGLAFSDVSAANQS
jgi:prolyl-tRNA editing enzyme YbaK/EbsC (Cys-tRNA(Pro) deacylase)